MNNPLTLPYELGQNALDFAAKQLQTIYDNFFGEENNNQDSPMTIPYLIDSQIVFNFSTWYYGGNTQGIKQATIPVFYDFHFDSSSDSVNYLSNPTIYKEFCRKVAADMTDDDLQNSIDFIENNTKDFIDFQKNSNFKIPVYPYVQTYTGSSYLEFRHMPNFPQLTGSVYQIYDITKNFLQSSETSSPPHYNALQYRMYSKSFTNTTNDSQWYQNYLYLNTYKDFRCITTGSDNGTITNITNNDNTVTNTYVTNRGDEITYYYNDNQIVIPVSPSVNMPIAPVLTYNDFKGIFDDIIDDLNLNLGTNLAFPSYDDIKYTDVGNFQIDSIHQYPPLQSAPDIALDIDTGDYIQAVGGSVNAYTNLLDNALGIGFSTFLVSAFIIIFLIHKLKG